LASRRFCKAFAERICIPFVAGANWIRNLFDSSDGSDGSGSQGGEDDAIDGDGPLLDPPEVLDYGLDGFLEWAIFALGTLWAPALSLKFMEEESYVEIMWHTVPSLSFIAAYYTCIRMPLKEIYAPNKSLNPMVRVFAHTSNEWSTLTSSNVSIATVIDALCAEGCVLACALFYFLGTEKNQSQVLLVLASWGYTLVIPWYAWLIVHHMVLGVLFLEQSLRTMLSNCCNAGNEADLKRGRD
jgi:hypothetical protein